jgi:GxxExxY protein
MHENDIAREVVDAAYHIHSKLGPGLLESVYRTILMWELKKRGFAVDKEVPIPLVWDNIHFEESFKADLIVECKLIVETKSISAMHSVRKRQLLTYLRLTNCRLGLLINFGEERVKDGISRVVNGLTEEVT